MTWFYEFCKILLTLELVGFQKITTTPTILDVSEQFYKGEKEDTSRHWKSKENKRHSN